jgi:hypothetical protein
MNGGRLPAGFGIKVLPNLACIFGPKRRDLGFEAVSVLLRPVNFC